MNETERAIVIANRILDAHATRDPDSDFSVVSRQFLRTLERVDARDPGFCWLIEAPGPAYLAARCIGHQYEFHWTADANKALRFVNETQADFTMMAVRVLVPGLFPSVLPQAPRAMQHKFISGLLS